MLVLLLLLGGMKGKLTLGVPGGELAVLAGASVLVHD